MSEQAAREPGGDARFDADTQQMYERATSVLESVANVARVERAFGEPYTAAGSTVIPVAEVTSGLGFGMGSGGGTSPAGDGQGGGAGGGAGARSRPVALVVIDQQGVSVKPVFDVARIGLAAIATAGFVALWLMRLATASRGEKVDARSLPAAKAFQSLLKMSD